MKICKVCRTEKPEAAFGLLRSSPDGRNGRCKDCRNQYAREMGATASEYRRKARYGLTPDDTDRLMDKTSGTCPLCLRSFSDEDFNLAPVVDHDHACCPSRITCGRCVRGLICRGCNLTLGRVESLPPGWVERVQKYLSR